MEPHLHGGLRSDAEPRQLERLPGCDLDGIQAVLAQWPRADGPIEMLEQPSYRAIEAHEHELTALYQRLTGDSKTIARTFSGYSSAYCVCWTQSRSQYSG